MLISLLNMLWHAGPDPGEDIRDSWRPELETVSADLYLISWLSFGKSPLHTWRFWDKACQLFLR